MTAMLASKGMDTITASRAAAKLLGSIVVGQSTVIAINTAFNAVALLFVIAVPVLLTVKIGLSRHPKKTAPRKRQRSASRTRYGGLRPDPERSNKHTMDGQCT